MPTTLAESIQEQKNVGYAEESVHVQGSSKTWLHVSVEIAMLVNVRKPLQNLITPASDPRLRDVCSPVFHQLVQVAILHNKQLGSRSQPVAGTSPSLMLQHSV